MDATEPIKITKEQKYLLDKLKIHSRQPYHEVLQYLLEPLTLPAFTEKEREESLKKLEHLRGIVRKRMEGSRSSVRKRMEGKK